MEQAGFDILAAAEFDPVHALTHKFNMPRTPVLCADLSAPTVGVVADELLRLARASWEEVNPGVDFSGLDAVVGGPPCQGFSVGGVRDAGDERNNQLLRFVDIVIQLQPRTFCLENVAGLLEPRFEPIRKEVIRRLSVDGGYATDGMEFIANAKDYGVPQNRRRLIFTGSRVGDPVALSPNHGQAVTVAEALEGLPDLSRYRRLLSVDATRLNEEDLLHLLGSKSDYARRLIGLLDDPADLSARRVHDQSIITNSLRTVHQPRTVGRFSRTNQGGVEAVSRLFRLDPVGQARTLRAGTGTERGSHTSPRPIHPTKNRVITVREAARLHGYPDWFRFHSTNWHGHRQVGNSVPPPLAAAAGRALVTALGRGIVERPPEEIHTGSVDWLRLPYAKAVKLT